MDLHSQYGPVCILDIPADLKYQEISSVRIGSEKGDIPLRDEYY